MNSVNDFLEPKLNQPDFKPLTPYESKIAQKHLFKNINDDKILEAAYNYGLLDYKDEQHEVRRRCMLQIARRCERLQS